MAVLGTLLLTGLLAAAGSMMPAVATAWQADLSQLPITFPVQSPEVAAYFSEMAQPGDMASVFPMHLFLLSQDTVGQKMVAFRSWTDAQSQLDTLTSPVDMVMYNPEHWELTPEDEQQDLAEIVQQFADAVHARGLRFMFAPDRRYAEEYLGQVGPYVDAVLLQGQRLQHDPQTFASWVLGMTDIARAANPDIQVFVQVGATRGTASEMLAAIQTVAGDIDGIAVWSMPRTLDVLQEFVALVRETPSPVEATPSGTPAATPAIPVSAESPTVPPPPATPTVVPTGHSTVTPLPILATPIPTQGPAATSDGTVTEITPSPVAPAPVPLPALVPPGAALGGWVTAVLLFVGGMGIGLFLGFLLGSRQRRGPRG